MDSIRPLQNYEGGIVPQAVLNGTLGTVVYASNYNDLDNKPSINSVELRGNKTAEDLGLATPADITVTSVNTQTGDVSLTGQNIPYDSTYSVTEKINDLESQIVDSGVSSVNGHTGAVILTGSDINYSVGVSLNAKIDAVEGEIPVINYPVTSVNGETGAVVLAGSDIEYSAGVSINTQIENVAGDLADLTAEDIPMSGNDSTKVSEAIGDLSTLTTSDTSSLIGAVNEVNEKATSEAIPLTVAQGATVAYASVSKNDKLVTITAEVRFSGGANTWTNLATIAFPPRVVQLSVPAVNSANGSLMGILQVQSSGNIRIYPTTAQNNGACAFSISYLTT